MLKNQKPGVFLHSLSFDFNALYSFLLNNSKYPITSCKLEAVMKEVSKHCANQITDSAKEQGNLCRFSMLDHLIFMLIGPAFL